MSDTPLPSNPVEDTESRPLTDAGESPSEPVSLEIPSSTEPPFIALGPEQYDSIKSGMTIRVFQRIKELTSKGIEREREQFFEGLVLARKHGRQPGATITVRKISHGVGVEKVFPLALPTIVKIQILKQMKRTRRSKLYFVRRGYKKRLKEVKMVE